MEVASPLTFDHTVAGTKRQFPCSPFDTTNRSPFAGMESPDEFVQQRSFKRRRFAVDESMEGDSENTVNQSPFLSHSANQKPFLSSSNGECRSHCRWFLNLFLVNFSFGVMSYRCRIHNWNRSSTTPSYEHEAQEFPLGSPARVRVKIVQQRRTCILVLDGCCGMRVFCSAVVFCRMKRIKSHTIAIFTVRSIVQEIQNRYFTEWFATCYQFTSSRNPWLEIGKTKSRIIHE